MVSYFFVRIAFFSREGIGPWFDAVVFLLPLPVVVALLAVDAIEVRSFTDCPSSDAIAAKLRPLLPDGPAQESRGDVAWVDPVAQVEGGAAEVRLRLVRSDATLVVDRRLVVEGSCDDMADTLATVLAAWRNLACGPGHADNEGIAAKRLRPRTMAGWGPGRSSSRHRRGCAWQSGPARARRSLVGWRRPAASSFWRAARPHIGRFGWQG